MFKLTKRDIIFTAAGAVIGAIVSYKIVDKKLSNEYHEKLNRVVKGHTDTDSINKKEEKEDSKEVSQDDISDYSKMVDDLMYMASEDEGNEIEEPDYEDDELAMQKVPNHPIVIGNDNYVEGDIAGNGYDVANLHYLQKSGILVDDDGNPVDMTEYIGNELIKRGFTQYNSTKDGNRYGKNAVWVRNYPYEMNYLVTWEDITAKEFNPDEYYEELDE